MLPVMHKACLLGLGLGLGVDKQLQGLLEAVVLLSCTRRAPGLCVAGRTV